MLTTQERSCLLKIASQCVTQKEIAERYGVSYVTVCTWARRYDTFPSPVLSVLDRAMLYDRDEVRTWVATHQVQRHPNGR
jgi:predicted DNA-binding transcriptional regulator AlpA